MTRLHNKGVFVVYDAERLLDYLLAGIGKPWGGARDAARLVERRLIQPIALKLLDFDGEGPVCIELTEAFYRHGALDPTPLTRRPPVYEQPPGFSGKPAPVLDA